MTDSAPSSVEWGQDASFTQVLRRPRSRHGHSQAKVLPCPLQPPISTPEAPCFLLMGKAPLTGPEKPTGDPENLLNMGLLCQLLPPGPSPLISGSWQEVDWKLEATSFGLSSAPLGTVLVHCWGAEGI